jgi:outer membrane protein OmpA-like peptidoglycan-associated protein
MVAAMPIVTTPVFVSDFDAMRAALPAFDLQRGGTEPASRREVSVVRDLVFAPASSILSRADVIRLQPLLAYLRANPTIAVRIEGFGDGINSTEHDTELSLSRAQAVARALLTDMMVSNAIVTVGAPVPQLMKDNGRAEIIFIGSAADYAL